MRTNVDLDDELMSEAFRLTNVSTKKELLHLALHELIHAKRKKNLLDLAGKIELRDDYDYKALRDNRHVAD
jgi:Arc/MetJ family transcription regulator